MITGIDVSHHQGEINWAEVAKDPKVQFAIIRSGHGVKEDRQFQRNWKEAQGKGIVLGVYHYYDHWIGAEIQATRFLEITHHAGVWDGPSLPPVVDVEDGPISQSHIGAWIQGVRRPCIECSFNYKLPGRFRFHKTFWRRS